MSSFTTPLSTTPLNKFRNGKRLYRLNEGFDYLIGTEESNINIFVPAGFETDFASTPKWSHFMFPPDGPWKKAAVVHDYLYCKRGMNRLLADSVFLDALIASEDVSIVTAWIFFLAVRVAGWRYYNRKQGETK